MTYGRFLDEFWMLYYEFICYATYMFMWYAIDMLSGMQYMLTISMLYLTSHIWILMVKF